MLTFLSQVSPKTYKFNCTTCDIKTNNKKDYANHLLTAKHIKNENLTNMNTNITINPQSSKYICTNCNKIYKSRVGLWTHKKTCIEEVVIKEKEKEGVILKMTDIQKAIPNMDMNLIFAFMKDTQEFKQIMLEQSNTMMEYNKQMMSDQNNIILDQNKIMSELVEKVGNTTNINTQNNQNNQFNLQFFLNDTCKGAMNVKDFLNFINVDLEDIEYIGTHGYVAGISRIFTKNLARLGKFEKPIWVTDEKRETIMYKEDGVWQKDEDHIRMNKISVAIEFKCIKAVVLWRELNPDWRENEKKGEFLNIMNGCVFGGELKANILHYPPDKDQKAKIVRSMIQQLKIPKKNVKEQILT
jgi:Zinc-finger of C2H2 type